jgi:hypothetical protein
MFHGREVVMAFLGSDAKSARFADFGRISTWLEQGAPGARVKLGGGDRPPPPRLRVSAKGRSSK